MATLFEARGYRIARNVEFTERGVACNLDGWDAAARVGFEYMQSGAGDYKDLTAAELEELGARMDNNELFVLIVDESGDERLLRFAAARFLDEVERRTSRGSAP